MIEGHFHLKEIRNKKYDSELSFSFAPKTGQTVAVPWRTEEGVLLFIVTAPQGLYRVQHLNITQTNPFGLKSTTPKKKPLSSIKTLIASVLPTLRIYNAPLTFSKYSKSPLQIQRWSVIQIKPKQLVLRGQALQCRQEASLPGLLGQGPAQGLPSQGPRTQPLGTTGKGGGEGEEAAWGWWRGRGMGQSLASASPGQKGRERAQGWTGISQGLSLSPAVKPWVNFSTSLRTSGISSVNSNEIPGTPNLARWPGEVNKIWKQSDNYQARWVVTVMGKVREGSDAFSWNSTCFLFENGHWTDNYL